MAYVYGALDSLWHEARHVEKHGTLTITGQVPDCTRAGPDTSHTSPSAATRGTVTISSLLVNSHRLLATVSSVPPDV